MYKLFFSLFLAILALAVKGINIDMTQVPLWLTAIGTLAVAFRALFLSPIREKLRRPKLEVLFNFEPPDCHLTTMAKQDLVKVGERSAQTWVTSDCYYFRIRIKNYGKTSAESVEVFAHTLLKYEKGSLIRVNDFLPMRLKWSHVNKPVFNTLAPQMEKHCDIGHILDPAKRIAFMFESHPKFDSKSAIFSFDLEVRPYTYSHLIAPGTYRLVLLIGASNIRKPEKRTLEIGFSGQWVTNEDNMFKKAIKITVL